MIVTWFVPGQPPNSYQSQFNSKEACDTAVAAVMAGANRVCQNMYDDGMKEANAVNSPGMAPLFLKPLPNVSAVCIAQ